MTKHTVDGAGRLAGIPPEPREIRVPNGTRRKSHMQVGQVRVVPTGRPRPDRLALSIVTDRNSGGRILEAGPHRRGECRGREGHALFLRSEDLALSTDGVLYLPPHMPTESELCEARAQERYARNKRPRFLLLKMMRSA